jgi:hypothetical protein
VILRQLLLHASEAGSLKQFLNTLWSVACRSQWPCGLRRRSSAARLLRSWVGIRPGAWIFVCCERCLLSGRGICDGLITRPEESYRLWRVVVCDQETSKTRRLKPATGLWKIQPQWVVTPGKQTTTNMVLCVICYVSLLLCYSQCIYFKCNKSAILYFSNFPQHSHAYLTRVNRSGTRIILKE